MERSTARSQPGLRDPARDRATIRTTPPPTSPCGAPTPRNNATAPTETGCTGGGDTDPPQTEITKEPKAKTTKAKAKFKFRSDETYSDFMCKLDKGGFEKCSSPFKEKVDPGKHKFSVFAIDRAGNEDPSPAKAKFKRVER